MARASWVTSPPATSQTSAIALMKEILVARKAFAATLTSSAVAKSVTTSGHLAVLGGGQVEDALVGGVEHAVGPLALDADDDPVGSQHVLDGEALLEELRAPRHLDAQVGGGVLADQLLDPLGGADRHGRLADDQRLAGQVLGQAGDRRLDVRQVGAHAVGALRGARRR